MRKSVIQGFLVLSIVALFGAGCETLNKWCGCIKPEQPIQTTAVTNLTDVLDKEDVAPQIGGSIDQLPIDAAANLTAVHFAFDSSLLSAQETAVVEKAAKYLLDNPNRVAMVDGNCDERGSNAYNLSLGEQRAQSVRKYMIDLGIDGSRIQTRSFGKEKPLDPGHNEAAWSKNRRGEFTIYITKK